MRAFEFDGNNIVINCIRFKKILNDFYYSCFPLKVKFVSRKRLHFFLTFFLSKSFFAISKILVSWFLWLTEFDGIRIGGRNVNNVRYADDMVLIADWEKS